MRRSATAEISSSKLQGASGYHDSYFFTDSTDGSMTFWDPENGQTTPNSNYPRTELKEVSGGATASWPVTGTHTMSATHKSTEIPDHVCVGQVHLGSGGTPPSTKPLFELFYYFNGNVTMAIESGPTGTETPNLAGNVPVPPYNAYRDPPFYRVDVRLEKRWSLGRNGYIAFIAEGQNVTLNKEVTPFGLSCRGTATEQSQTTQCSHASIGPITIPSLGVEASF